MQLEAIEAYFTEDGARHSSRRAGSTPIIRHLLELGSQEERRESGAVVEHERYAVTQSDPEDEMSEDGGIQAEIVQRRPFHSVKAEVAVSILRTAALIERHFAQVVAQSGITVQQYNVLRILRGAEPEGLCRNELRDRMLSRMPDVTRLLDRMEEAGLVTRERSSEDRRQVTTRITPRGRRLVDELDPIVAAEHQRRLGHLSAEQLRTLVDLLTLVRQP